MESLGTIGNYGDDSMEAKKDARLGNLGDVIPRCDSQTGNPVGVDWLHISFDYREIRPVKVLVGHFFGDYDKDEVRLLGYTDRIAWPSGVNLCFDSDPEKHQKAHRGRMTLQVTGRACNELTAPDLLLFMEGCESLGGGCSRIDICWDDYGRTVSLDEIREVIDKCDYTKFEVASKDQTRNRTVKQNSGIIYDAVTFGRRGSFGSGKYLRIYDKNIESKGKHDCIRWECEFSQHRAEKVFKMLAGVSGDIECFATICGALIGGCVGFVHRTGDKNLSRLEPYEWWERIKERLGELTVRIAKKKNTLTGMIEYQVRSMSPSLACIRKTFVNPMNFYNWIQDTTDDAEPRMNANQRQIVKQNEGCLTYERKCNGEKQYSDYLNAMCTQID